MEIPGSGGVAGYVDIAPLAGGHAGETFTARPVDADGRAGQTCVLRLYGVGTRRRGPEAPGVQAGVLRLVAGLIPAPRLLELREPGPGVTQPLVAATLLPGLQLSTVLAELTPDQQTSIGTSLGEILGRMAGCAFVGPGSFLNDQLRLGPYPEHSESLVTWVEQFRDHTALSDWSPAAWSSLVELARRGDRLLAVSPRAVLVHGDLSTRNLLADPEAGVITGIVDWEFAHAGHPVEDLGKVLRDTWGTPFAEATVDAMNPWLPQREQADVTALAERARAADLYWISEVASRRGQSPATYRAYDLLRRMVAATDLLAI